MSNAEPAEQAVEWTASEGDPSARVTSGAPSARAGDRPASSGSRRVRLWDVFAEQVALCGSELFDIEVPSSMKGTIRIFIAKQPGSVSASSTSSKDGSSKDVNPQDSCIPAEQTDQPDGCQPEGSQPQGSQLEGSTESSDTSEVSAVEDQDVPQQVSQQGVSLQDCTRVSKHLSVFMDSEEGKRLGLSTEQWNLEVSSPGINRVLKRPEHFDNAVGERLSVRFAVETAEFTVNLPPEGAGRITPKKRPKKRGNKLSLEQKAQKEIERIKKKQVATGVLQQCTPEFLTLESDDLSLMVKIPRSAVAHARVDFLFEQR